MTVVLGPPYLTPVALSKTLLDTDEAMLDMLDMRDMLDVLDMLDLLDMLEVLERLECDEAALDDVAILERCDVEACEYPR